MIRAFIKVVLFIYTKIVYRIKIVGYENVPKEGKVILCANHVHAMDSVAWVVNSKRHINMIAKEELFKNAFFAWLGKIFDVIAIKRGSSDIDAMKRAFKVLKNDGIIGIFPEGTRNGMAKGEKVHNGAALIALKTNTQIIPVGIQGSFKLFTKVKINYGKPMNFSEYISQKSDKAVLDKITNEVMNEVVRLRDEKI